MFPSLKIYSSVGQNYEAVDKEMLLAYVEATDGQILHEGITEAGSMGSFHAAGSSYATFGEAMIPVYVFYSMFGFQRTGDQIWSAADRRARGFLLGATAGRTTLTGEGLQHNDGHSLLLAASNPAVESYDPSFAYEIAVYLEHGLERMLGDGEPAQGEDVIYYLTLYNEPVVQPAMPDHVTDEDIRRGIYRYAAAPDGRDTALRILASGSAMTMAREAATLLADEFDLHAEVWSVPGWVQLHRDGIATDEHNRLAPSDRRRTATVTGLLSGSEAPVVAVTDFQRAVPQLIDRWVPAPYHTLGIDGFGVAEARSAARRHFGIDAQHITLTALSALVDTGQLDRTTLDDARQRLAPDTVRP